MFYAAYLSEIFRGGLQGIAAGQREAAHALGLSEREVLTRVVMPQAVRLVMPATTTMLVDMLKSTSLLITISAAELMTAGQLIASATFRAMEVYFVIGVIYFAMCYPLSMASLWLERRLKAGSAAVTAPSPPHRPGPAGAASGRTRGAWMNGNRMEQDAVASDAGLAGHAAVVRVEKLVKSFGHNRVLDGIDLEIKRGEVVSLMGQSGGGKTTLLRCINLLEEPTAGVVEVGGEMVSENGKCLHRARRAQLRQRVGMVFQSFNLFHHLTAAENVALPLLRVGKVERGEAVRRSVDLLARVGLADKALELPARLSGGQQQRVAIARALALRPVAMLFDEPTSALDPESSQEVLGVMRELSTEGITMLVSTHEVGFALDASDRIVFIDRGKVVHAGPPREVVFGSASERTREFFAGFVRHDSTAG